MVWDVVVLGGGLAGHCAALEAAVAGARVLLLEREAEVGGSTRISAGLMALAGTPLQAASGVEDGPALLERDLRETGGGVNDPSLVRAYAGGQPGLWRWLAGLGIAFDGLERGGGQSVARAHHADPRAVMRRLEEAASAAGVGRRTGTPALRLERRDAGILRVLTADGAVEARGVVLATGGFALSAPLLAAFAGDLDGALRVGAPGSLGEGLRMGCALGAGLRDMGHIKGTFGAHPDSGGTAYHALLAFYMGGIVVNRAGERFVDEEVSYKLIGEACLRQPDALGFQVFDEGVMRASRPGLALFDLEAQLRAGRLVRADTPEALAAACGIDPAGLARTLLDYNRGVDAGRDALGRTGLCSGVGALVRLDRPPFHAFASRTALLATYCGLAVDPDAAVLDAFDHPIAGLFAAGEVAGGFHGRAYMTGAALGSAAFFGRRAGASAALHAARSTSRGGMGR